MPSFLWWWFTKWPSTEIFMSFAWYYMFASLDWFSAILLSSVALGNWILWIKSTSSQWLVCWSVFQYVAEFDDWRGVRSIYLTLLFPVWRPDLNFVSWQRITSPQYSAICDFLLHSDSGDIFLSLCKQLKSGNTGAPGCLSP